MRYEVYIILPMKNIHTGFSFDSLDVALHFIRSHAGGYLIKDITTNTYIKGV